MFVCLFVLPLNRIGTPCIIQITLKNNKGYPPPKKNMSSEEKKTNKQTDKQTDLRFKEFKFYCLCYVFNCKYYLRYRGHTVPVYYNTNSIKKKKKKKKRHQVLNPEVIILLIQLQDQKTIYSYGKKFDTYFLNLSDACNTMSSAVATSQRLDAKCFSWKL